MIPDSLPLISIIITSYNRSNFISQAISSALSQSYPNLEVLIVDNCSTDNSDAVIKQYVHDKRINYIRNESNIGMISNFQKGIELARGEYLSFISSDDYYIEPDFISEAAGLFRKYDNVVFIKGGGVLFHADTSQFEPYDYSRLIRHIRPGKEMFMEFQNPSSPMGFDAILIDNKKLKSLEICYDPLMILLDNEINLKLCLEGDVAFLNKPCYAFRVHPNQATKIYGNETLQANMAIVDRAKEAALQKDIFSKEELNSWHYSLQRSTLRYNYIKKYVQDFKAFAAFEKIFRERYQDLFNSIEKEPRIRILKLLFNRYYNFMGLLRLVAPRYYKIVMKLKINMA